jgi:hypothetical protein
MQTRTLWTRLPFVDGRWLVYSPRFARTYLVPPDLASSSRLPRVFGLSRSSFRDPLADPAETDAAVNVAVTEAGGDPPTDVGRLLPGLYRFFHRHRTVASVSRALLLCRWLAVVRRGPGIDAVEIGETVKAVERAVGVSDCYPRALLTAYLCMRARVDCEVTIGILAPTTNLHAWCSSQGTIPYEPRREHWFYQPLVVLRVTQ